MDVIWLVNVMTRAYATEEERVAARRASDKKRCGPKRNEQARARYPQYRKSFTPEKIKKLKDRSNKWYYDHWDEERLKQAKIRREVRAEIFFLLGGKCVRCGYSNPKALQIDHINGGGNIEKKKYGGYYRKKILKDIKSGSTDYQLLCANCNTIKLYDDNETGMMVDINGA